MRFDVTSLALCLVTAVPIVHGQTLLVLPEASQRASLTQRLGITDITLAYHRPLVNGRKVWGGIVPYSQVWRAGANENTTITFTDPVSVEGQPLAKGIYGLHMIPGTDTWTVIFSKNSSAWGSFTYKPEEDALRVTVKPGPSDMHEALTYDFDEVKPDSATVTMRWEKLAVPFRVSVDEKAITMASLNDQLRGGMQYTWEAWAEASNYALAKKTDLDQALKWADASLGQEERYDTLMQKARVLDALNRSAESTPLRKHALEMANSTQLYFYGRQLQLVEKKTDEAMETFRQTAQRFPDSWTGHMAAARVNSASGNFQKAADEMRAAQSAAPDSQKPTIAAYLKKLEAGQDIN